MSEHAEGLVEIRRYPNRRFYDRSRRRYVTLQEIEELVLEGKTVVVRDSRTGEDLTRQVLTQILMERHPRKMELFPSAMLHSVLRANDLAMELWRGCLRQSLAAMEAWPLTTPPAPVAPFANPRDWVAAFFPGFAPAAATTARPTAPPVEPNEGPPDDAGRIDDIEARLARLEAERGPSRSSPESSTRGPAAGTLDGLEARVARLETSRRPATRTSRAARKKT